MTFFIEYFLYNIIGDNMKVKVFDASHELDLENDINAFIRNVEVIDIKYSVAASIFADEQVYCFSALILYKEGEYIEKK